MRAETGDAAAPISETAASDREIYYQANCTKAPPGLSSTKLLRENLAEQVATLLLYLNKLVLSPTERKQGWRLFEFALRRYIDLKYCGMQL